MLVKKAIQLGLPYKLSEQIQPFTTSSDVDCAQYLDLSFKSLQRYRDEIYFSFKPIHTEKKLN